MDGGEEGARQVRTAYRRQATRWSDRKYRSWMPGNLHAQHDFERAYIDLLRRNDMLPLDGRRVLEVGCGEGKKLIRFHALGASLHDLAGIDIVPENVQGARRLAPGVDFRLANATNMPFADGAFDLVLAFTSLSSMTDDEMRLAAAREITRVLKPGGAVLVYDFRVNPRNSDVKALSIRDLRRLFPEADVQTRRVTLAPPLARAVGRVSPMACELLARVPFLRTHWVALIRPREVPG